MDELMLSSNASTEEFLQPPTTEELCMYYMAAGVTMAVWLVGSSANAIAILTFLTHRTLLVEQPVFLLLLNLSIADFAICFFGTPMMFTSAIKHGWVFGSLLCNTYSFCMSIAGITNACTVAAIAIQRYRIMTHQVLMTPGRHKRSLAALSSTLAGSTSADSLTSENNTVELNSPRAPPGMLLVLGLIWLYAMGVSLPPLLGWSSNHVEGIGFSCAPRWGTIRGDNGDGVLSYSIFLIVMAFCLPAGCILLFYMLLIRHVKASSMTTSQNFGKRIGHLQRLVAIMITVFMSTWLPYATMSFFVMLGFEDSMPLWLKSLPVVWCKFSVALNPIVYYFTVTALRKAIRKTLSRLRCCCCGGGGGDKQKSRRPSQKSTTGAPPAPNVPANVSPTGTSTSGGRNGFMSETKITGYSPSIKSILRNPSLPAVAIEKDELSSAVHNNGTTRKQSESLATAAPVVMEMKPVPQLATGTLSNGTQAAATGNGVLVAAAPTKNVIIASAAAVPNTGAAVTATAMPVIISAVATPAELRRRPSRSSRRRRNQRERNRRNSASGKSQSPASPIRHLPGQNYHHTNNNVNGNMVGYSNYHAQLNNNNVSPAVIHVPNNLNLAATVGMSSAVGGPYMVFGTAQEAAMYYASSNNNLFATAAAAAMPSPQSPMLPAQQLQQQLQFQQFQQFQQQQQQRMLVSNGQQQQIQYIPAAGQYPQLAFMNPVGMMPVNNSHSSNVAAAFGGTSGLSNGYIMPPVVNGGTHLPATSPTRQQPYQVSWV